MPHQPPVETARRLVDSERVTVQNCYLFNSTRRATTLGVCTRHGRATYLPRSRGRNQQQSGEEDEKCEKWPGKAIFLSEQLHAVYLAKLTYPVLPNGFLGFINEHRLFTPTDRVLLAVSGGLDSVVLASLMHQAGFTFGMAHVNFGLRGADSDADAAFVENLASTYTVPFHQTRFDTTAEAAQRGESIQVTARQLRYDWFSTLQAQHGYVAVATAHHLNDVLETMLINLTRGTGLAGLRGIPIVAETGTSRVVRPLWFAPRAAINTYATEQELVWRNDASNATDAYSRNQIRHQVVPVLEQINPGLMQTLLRTLSQLQATEAIVQADVAASFGRCVQRTHEGLVIEVGTLANESEPLFRLGEWLRTYGFTPDVLTQCWATVDPTCHVPYRNGQVFLALNYRLLHDRGQLWLLPHPADPPPTIRVNNWPAEPIPIPPDGQLSATLLDRTGWDGTYPTDPDTALLDADTLPFPWTVRRWREGDRFGPLGMTGTQLVSDFLANQKVPLLLRERVWVLESDGRVLWVIGWRVAQAARITTQTSQMLLLRWQASAPEKNGAA